MLDLAPSVQGFDRWGGGGGGGRSCVEGALMGHCPILLVLSCLDGEGHAVQILMSKIHASLLFMQTMPAVSKYGLPCMEGE